ncbi:ketohydroxyglutarate aldolase [Rivularia sp. UHCC 0363]|uniref:ketohydroxyglutarate aldolase n=1 Tax=Rivularia sp. UHCC 0363 TaxID=3110244 RepID=UPI002B21066B|nr:ketohydroxyglutarate aldolase [Rivularia sp. UHCC 0363]MEA5595439.1 ketohydroxyglutarate aldolase [Rivularia sp. UHCC 0363]
MNTVNISVSVDDEYLDKILDVAANLQASGMNVENIMPIIGVITGSVESTQMDGLTQVEGVNAVEVSRTFRAL